MLIRTYSCSSRTEKTKSFFKARSAAALQNGCKEFYHLVPAILRCGSVFRQKKTWISISTGQKVIQFGIYGLVISPGLFLLFLFSHDSKSKPVLSNVKEVTVAECQLIGFISCTARC